MRNIINIYMLDVKNMMTNWVILIIIGGLVLLPSLYAWLNIKASWDPYGQTNQIPVGVVNEDEGAVIRDERIHVGNDIVDTLKENRNFNWQFVNRHTAMKEVEYGNYYAVIVIPKEFSTMLGTVISKHPEKAQIDYYVNEKMNAIAPKITEKGASVIVEKISSQFIATINGVIFDMFNQIGLELEADLPDIKQFEKYLFTLEAELPSIYDLLVSTNDDGTKALQMIEKANKAIPEVSAMTKDGLHTVDEAITVINKAEQRFENIAPKINEDVKAIQNAFDQFSQFVNSVDGTLHLHDQIEYLDEIKNTLTNTSNTIENVLNSLNGIQESVGEENEAIAQAIDTITLLVEPLKEVEKEIDKVTENLANKETELESFFKQIVELEKRTNERFNAFLSSYTEEIEPVILQKLKEGKQAIFQARAMLEEVQSTIPEVEKLLHSTMEHLTTGKDVLTKVLNEFPYVNDKVKELANRVRQLKSQADINDIIQLLQNDPQAEKGFFAEPVVLNKNELFPIPNYGTGMTPFYTVLAIWVGCLLLISLLSTDLHVTDGMTLRHVYVGRLLTILTIGLLQVCIVTIGDIFLLRVDVNSKMLFILFGLFISVVFMTIVYTVVSLFGDVGKAMAIILLVLQIASSGGTYPVVLLPEFFQAINPFLPFTYGVDLMREAVGGIIWHRVIKDLLLLALFGSLFFTVGLLLKEPINKRLHKILQSKGSRLFH